MTYGLLGVILALCATGLGSYMVLKKKREAMQSSWQLLKAHVDDVLGLLPGLVKCIKAADYHDPMMMDCFRKARDGVKKQKAQKAPKDYWEAYAFMQKGMKRLSAAKPEALFAGNPDFDALWEAMLKYDEKIIFEKDFFNAHATAYNQLVTRLPFAVVAGIVNYKMNSYFDAV